LFGFLNKKLFVLDKEKEETYSHQHKAKNYNSVAYSRWLMAWKGGAKQDSS
jgi:hypothetical protein